MNLRHFKNELQLAQDVIQTRYALKNFLLNYGIHTYSFTFYAIHPQSCNKIKHEFCSSNFKKWHEHYLQENYDEIDTTFDNFRVTTLPIYWEVQQQIKDAKTQKELQMRKDSYQYGARKGLSIPLYGPYQGYASLTLIQMVNETCLDQWEEIQCDLFAGAHLFFTTLHRFLLMKHDTSKNRILSNKEQICLQLIAENYSLEKIAETMNITVRTVNFHIQRINKKLQAKNKYQSIINARKMGLIS